MLLTAIAGIIMLIILVVVHEFGHALVARLCGVGVAEFGIGFGKPRIKLGTIKKFQFICAYGCWAGMCELSKKRIKNLLM